MIMKNNEFFTFDNNGDVKTIKNIDKMTMDELITSRHCLENFCLDLKYEYNADMSYPLFKEIIIKRRLLTRKINKRNKGE